MLVGAEIYNTYGVNAGAIRGKILPAVDALVASSSAGVDAAAWVDLLAKEDVGSALKNVEDPVLLEALAFEEGVLPR